MQNKVTITWMLTLNIFVMGSSILTSSPVKGTPMPATDVIEVTGDAELQDQWHNTGNLSVIPAENIQFTAAAHPNELFKQVPGVWISRGSGQEHLTALRSAVLTGPGACGAVELLENGIPIRPQGFCNVNGLFEAPLSQAHTLEVVRGPSSALTGANGLNGAINVLTLRTAPEQRLSAALGSHDRKQLSARYIGDSAGFDIELDESQSFRDHEGYDQQKVLLQQHSNLGQWHQHSILSATRLNQNTASYIVGEDSYQHTSLAEFNPTPDAYRDAWSLRWQTHLEHSSGWRVTPFARRSQMQFAMHFLPQTPVEQNAQSSVGIALQKSLPLTDHQTLLWRTQVEMAEVSLKQYQEAATQGPFPTGDHYNFRVLTRYLSQSLSWQLQQGDWTHTLGANLGYIHYDYDNHLEPGGGNLCSNTCRYWRPESGEDEFLEGAFRATSSVIVSAHSEVFAAFSRGYRPPQITELYRLQSGQLDADLEAESINSLETGIRWKSATYHHQITGFRQEKSHVILQDSQRILDNKGKTSALGLEIESSMTLNPQHSINLTTSYAKHQYATDLESLGGTLTNGNDIDTAPRWTAALRWHYQAIDWSTQLELDHLGDYYLDAENQFRYPGHTLLHWRSNYSLNNSLLFYGHILNVTNEKYAERADMAFSGEPRYFPGQPRTFLFGLRWQS